MILIIDAYNVLKREMSQREISDHTKHQFIQDLQAYNATKKFTIYVVFDGGESKWSTKDWYNRVCVVHSGYQYDADSFIKNLIQEYARHETLVVTSDNELGRYANENHVPTIDSTFFYSVFQKAKAHGTEKKQKSHGFVKITTQSNEEVDALMREASRLVPSKQEDVGPAQPRAPKNSQALSKQEKQLIKLLEKLQD